MIALNQCLCVECTWSDFEFRKKLRMWWNFILNVHQCTQRVLYEWCAVSKMWCIKMKRTWNAIIGFCWYTAHTCRPTVFWLHARQEWNRMQWRSLQFGLHFECEIDLFNKQLVWFVWTNSIRCNFDWGNRDSNGNRRQNKNEWKRELGPMPWLFEMCVVKTAHYFSITGLTAAWSFKRQFEIFSMGLFWWVWVCHK